MKSGLVIEVQRVPLAEILAQSMFLTEITEFTELIPAQS
jgi:hypothetical protein